MHTEIEERVDSDRLEALLGEFIIHRKMAFTRLERSLDRMEEDTMDLMNFQRLLRNKSDRIKLKLAISNAKL